MAYLIKGTIVVQPELQLNDLVRAATEEFEASTEQQMEDDLHDISGGVPVELNAPPPQCNEEYGNPFNQEYDEEFLGNMRDIKTWNSATRRKNAKRGEKRKELTEKRKDEERMIRQRTAMETTIYTQLSLDDVNTSDDMFTTPPSLKALFPSHPGTSSFEAQGADPNVSSAVAQKNAGGEDSCPGTLSDALARGFSLIEWDGRKPQPIADPSGIVYVHLAGRPGASYDRVFRDADNAIRRAGERIRFRNEQKKSRRGEFPTINIGFSSGNGNSKPHMLRVHTDQAPILQGLLSNPACYRISGYANGAFKEFAPNLHAFYKARMEELYTQDEALRPPFAQSVFACMAINFGPRVVSIPHKDNLNLAYGWCAITALGNFDPVAGGHMVLPDLKLVIQFPAGSTIFIPSAAFIHYNLPIAPEEERRSITQFSAGGLFRWIAYGHQEKGVAVASQRGGTNWWQRGEGLYTGWPSAARKEQPEW